MTRLTRSRMTWLVCTAAVFVAVSAYAANQQQLQYLRQYRQCPKCDLKKAELAGMDLSSANLQEADLSGATIYRTNLRKANLTGAKLEGVRLIGSWLKDAVGADFTGVTTDESTECPDGQPGPCH